MPALRFEDEDVLIEATAILVWLGATHGKEGYAPSSRLGRKEAEALAYMSSEVHGDLYGPLQHSKVCRERGGAG